MDVIERSAIRRELDAQRASECRPLTRDDTDDELFFCGLGTLWCTEAHGPLAWQGGDEWTSRDAGTANPYDYA